MQPLLKTAKPLWADSSCVLSLLYYKSFLLAFKQNFQFKFVSIVSCPFTGYISKHLGTSFVFPSTRYLKTFKEDTGEILPNASQDAMGFLLQRCNASSRAVLCWVDLWGLFYKAAFLLVGSQPVPRQKVLFKLFLASYKNETKVGKSN